MIKGDVIQITNKDNKWYPCLLVIDEVKSWGVQAYAFMPSQDGKTQRAFYRIKNGEFENIGIAKVIGW